MSTREISSDLSTSRDTAHPFATQSKSVIMTVNGISAFKSGRYAAWVVGRCRFVYLSHLFTHLVTDFGFHRPSSALIYAGGTGFVVRQPVTFLLAYFAGHVRSFKNTERSSWKSRASTLFSYFCSVISCGLNSTRNSMITTFDLLFMARNITCGSGRETTIESRNVRMDNTCSMSCNVIHAQTGQ